MFSVVVGICMPVQYMCKCTYCTFVFFIDQKAPLATPPRGTKGIIKGSIGTTFRTNYTVYDVDPAFNHWKILEFKAVLTYCTFPRLVSALSCADVTNIEW